MNIIQTKASLFSFWWKAWLATLLLMFGVPTMAARFVMLSSDETRLSLLQGQHVPPEQLETFYLSRRKAAVWFPENALFNDLAMATFDFGAVAQGDAAKAFLQESALWERKALMVSPADAYGWYRMAYLYYTVEGASPRVEKAWVLSLASAPYEPRLTMSRLQMAIGLGSAFLAKDVAKIYLPPLIRDAWDRDPDALAKLAREGSFISIVEDVLRNDPEDLAAFREKTGFAVNKRLSPAH